MQRWEELAYAREDGIAEGEHMRLVSQICKKMKMNQSLERSQRIWWRKFP